jgi:hypothetical protein
VLESELTEKLFEYEKLRDEKINNESSSAKTEVI